jgi:5-methylcytosine-specific restriction enzyme A
VAIVNGWCGNPETVSQIRNDKRLVFGGGLAAFLSPTARAKTFLPYPVFMSTQRAMAGGWVDRDELEKGPSGRNLCRWCHLEVPGRRVTFCSDWCVHEWKLRTDAGYLREKVFERDRGVCTLCGIDCVAAYTHIRRLRGGARLRAAAEWNLGGRKSLWDADHVIPVVEGGGECDLSNMRTLCLKCHRTQTLEIRRRLQKTQR